MDKGPMDDFFNSSLFTSLMVGVFTMWGGLVSYFSKMRKFSWRRFLTHLSSSSFAGAVTYLLCQSVGISGSLTGALCGVAAHMGTPAFIELLLRLKVVRNFLNEGDA